MYLFYVYKIYLINRKYKRKVCSGKNWVKLSLVLFKGFYNIINVGLKVILKKKNLE